jgi:hypothetical protein
MRFDGSGVSLRFFITNPGINVASEVSGIGLLYLTPTLSAGGEGV